MTRTIITPRWYQDEAVDSIWQYFADGGEGNPVVALPTGTGKSVVIATYIKNMLEAYDDLRFIKLTHVKELIEQNFGKLTSLWPLAPAGIYSAGLGRREHSHPITFAGIASVARKAALFGHIDQVLIDECHLLGQKETSLYQTFIAELKAVNPELRVVGFTATPFRLGQGMLTDEGLFTDLCYNLTDFAGFNRLLDEGFLAPLVPKHAANTLDVSRVKMHGGEFSQHELQAAVDKASITKAAVLEMLEYGQDRKHWLVFAAGVEHSDHVAEQLNAAGISAVSIHSKMTWESLPSACANDRRKDEEPRDVAIRWWKRGKFRAAVNNNVLTTGIDFPGIDLIGMLRPTASPVLWVQMLGRGTRPYEGKENCLVLDFAGNTARLGPINDPVLPRKRGAKGKGVAPVKLCPTCGTYNHSSVRFCTSCGAEFIAEVKIQENASTLELISTGEPVTEIFPVDVVEYDVHTPSDGRAPSLLVRYRCGQRVFKEWVSLEHHFGGVKHKARDWWRERAGCSPPDTVEEALTRLSELAEPVSIKVWLNRKYPEILHHFFGNV